MRASVEARTDIAFEHPLRPVFLTESNEAGFHCIRRTATSPNSVGVRISRRFGDRVKGQQVEGLHRPVMHGRIRERASSAIALGNGHAPSWQGMVSSLGKRLDGFCFLFWRVPDCSINARGSFASVFRHSPHGKRLAAERMGQYTLQGFDLAPFSSLSCLRETGLEPTNRAFSFSPVALVPGYKRVGSRTNRGVRRLFFGRFRCHLLSLLDRLVKRSRAERPEGSLPAFA